MRSDRCYLIQYKNNISVKTKLIFTLFLIILLNGCILFVMDEIDELPKIEFNFDNNQNISSIDYDKIKTIINIDLHPCTENYLEGDVYAANDIKSISFYKTEGEEEMQLIQNFTIERGFDTDSTHHFKIPAIAHEADCVGYNVNVEDYNNAITSSKTVYFHYSY